MFKGRSVLFRFLLVFIPAAGIALAVLFTFHFLERDRFIDRIKANEGKLVRAETRVLLSRLEQYDFEALFWADFVGRRMSDIRTRKERERALAELKLDFVAWMNRRKDVDQLRYLDASGMEIVRVESRNGTVVSVPSARLQDKSDRGYFTNGMKTRGCYVSRFDLNMENGEIEEPFKPMLRFSAGVDAKDGHRIGLVVLNVLGQSIFQRLKIMSAASEGRVYMLNSDGYWLSGPTPDMEWGFMFPDRTGHVFQARYPEVREKIQDVVSGQFETDQGLFTYERLDLGVSIARHGGRAVEFWEIVSHVPPVMLQHHAPERTWLVILLLLIPLAGAVLHWARNSVVKDENREKLREAEARFRTIVGNLPGVVYRSEPGPERTIQFVSRNVIMLTGYSPEDFVENRTVVLSDIIHPDDLDRVTEEYVAAARENRPYLLKHRIIRADGEVRCVHDRGTAVHDDNGNVVWVDGVVMDTTEQTKAEQALKDSESMLRAMSEASQEAIVVIRSDDTVVLWNPAAEKMFGYREDEVKGNHLHEFVAMKTDRDAAYKGMPEFSRTGTGAVVGTMAEMQAVRKSGDIFPVERSVAAFQREGEWYAVGVMRDVTERIRARERLRELATTDSLTGLNNRRNFMEVAGRALARARRYKEGLAGIMFDVDHFKKVNDTYGHDAGDEVLRVLSRSAVSTFRDVDIVGRLGGEEFGVFLPQVDSDNAAAVAERFRSVVENTVIPTDAGELKITISMGVAVDGASADSVEHILKSADQALYEAKNTGRNKVVVRKAVVREESGGESE